MALQLAPSNQVLGDEVQISYFVKRKDTKNSRVSVGRLLDISNAGLCMEILPEDSELYMESAGKLFLLNRNIDIQIFCRSYPSNISIEGCVKWIKRKDESPGLGDEDNICVGVLFSFANADQRKELAKLVALLRNDTILCAECNAPVFTEAALCYNCGARLVRKRAFLKNILHGLLAGDKKV